MSWVIHMLVDNVSKNGNLLLNVVQRPDGSLDPEVEQMLKELADWNAIHSEAIFGTRPWLVYGESALKVKGGHFKEDYKYNAREIRFTTKGNALYALALGWPEDGRLLVRSIAKRPLENINNLTSVSLLGYNGKLQWKVTNDGLEVGLPAKKVSAYTAVLKITGTELTNVAFTNPVVPVMPDVHGHFKLTPDDADVHGDQIKTESHGGQPNIGFWDKGTEWVSWNVKFPQAGAYEVSASVASVSGASEFVVDGAGQQLAAKADKTDGWDQFKEISLGRIRVAAPGVQVMSVRPKDPANWKAMNLRFVKLSKAE